MKKTGERDCLQLWKNGKPKYCKIMKILGFGKRFITYASDVPSNQIESGKALPPQIKQHFRQWAKLINLVGEFFDGNQKKTKLWFTLPNPNLGGISPRNMILFGRCERLSKFITNSLAENNP